MNKQLTAIDEVTNLWKEKNIEEAVMEFSCGGDSMNDTSWTLYDTKNKKVECQEIIDYLDNDVYNKVEFYVNSDGHYQGEFGSVKVTLDEDDEEPSFNYTKSSSSEWSETHTEKTEIELTDEQIKFVSDYVENIGGNGDGDFGIDYKVDFIHTDKHEKIESDLEDVILDFVRGYTPDISEGDVSDWVTFRCTDEDDSDDKIKINGNKLTLIISNSINIIKQDEF